MNISKQTINTLTELSDTWYDSQIQSQNLYVPRYTEPPLDHLRPVWEFHWFMIWLTSTKANSLRSSGYTTTTWPSQHVLGVIHQLRRSSELYDTQTTHKRSARVRRIMWRVMCDTSTTVCCQSQPFQQGVVIYNRVFSCTTGSCHIYNRVLSSTTGCFRVQQGVVTSTTGCCYRQQGVVIYNTSPFSWVCRCTKRLTQSNNDHKLASIQQT